MESGRRILLIGHSLPPQMSGVGIVIKRLFDCFKKNSYVVLSSRCEKNSERIIDSNKLSCRYYFSSLRSFYSSYTRKASILEWLQVLPAVIQGLFIIKKEKISDLLIVPTTGTFLLTAYILYILSQRCLSIYFFDLFAGNKPFMIRWWLSWPIERLSVRAAKIVFVMSEALKEHYKREYAIEPIVLPHPIEIESDEVNLEPLPEYQVDTKLAVIVFTGFIYEYQIGPLQNLAKAVKEMNSVEVHIYTSRSNEYLIKMGVYGKNIIYKGFVEPEKIPLILKKADILFLPMDFDPPSRKVIQTASPSKLPEYLASGTAILVHAQSDAYISWYARKHGWGLMVDKPDPELLKRAILKLLDDKILQRFLIKNARKTALLHDINRVVGILRRGLRITT